MLLLLIILIVLGIVLILDSEENSIQRFIGILIIAFTCAYVFPAMIRNTVQYTKEQGIEEYLDGKVDRIEIEDQVIYLWN